MLTFTPTDWELIRTLSEKVRAITEHQALRLFAAKGSKNPRATLRRFRRLIRLGLLGQTRALARPVMPLEAPIYSWQPDAPEPNYSALAWRLEKRWRSPLESTRIYFAGPRAIRIFGGWADGELNNLPQLSHDLHVSEIYLRFLTADPDRAALWTAGERIKATAAKFTKVPDAILCDHDEHLLAIDFGGVYGPQKLEAFHRNMLERELPYEMW